MMKIFDNMKQKNQMRLYFNSTDFKSTGQFFRKMWSIAYSFIEHARLGIKWFLFKLHFTWDYLNYMYLYVYRVYKILILENWLTQIIEDF